MVYVYIFKYINQKIENKTTDYFIYGVTLSKNIWGDCAIKRRISHGNWVQVTLLISVALSR